MQLSLESNLKVLNNICWELDLTPAIYRPLILFLTLKLQYLRICNSHNLK